MKWLALWFALPIALMAQSVTIKATSTRLSPAGGTLVLTASADYDGVPQALGWTIALPPSWRLVAVGGPNLPAVVPDAGASGSLEFAYTTVPAGHIVFTTTIEYPADAAAVSIASAVFVRQSGELKTIATTPLELRARAQAEPNAKK